MGFCFFQRAFFPANSKSFLLFIVLRALPVTKYYRLLNSSNLPIPSYYKILSFHFQLHFCDPPLRYGIDTSYM